ncbi:hypothetical protein [Agaribacter marinus]|uniref:PEP-CTERM protein-sorting domain-containing protein n=1 Tax=Agaribacter marinus TaxID=1431249 RepID=A0AA37SZL9_9ALTE|nr:hypothetical protein [Agaribacter marinus]GLR71289.1 hypothetical protein GCM10007852_21970 [Agaribacter marinus]
MKKLLIASLITLMSFGSSAGLVFSSNSSTVGVGDTITLDIAFDFNSSARTDDIYEFGLDLVFDPSVVAFDSAVLVGPYATLDEDMNGFDDYDLGIDDFSFADLILFDVFNLDFTAPLLPTTGVVDLLSVQFTALDFGAANFMLESVALVDSFFSEEILDATFETSVTVVDVPTPLVFSFVGLGITLLMLRRKE